MTQRTPKKFAGKWRITTMEGFSSEALDLAGPAHMKFTTRPVGLLSFIAVQGEMDCRFEGNRVEFSWAGDEEGDDASGRGWANVEADGKLRGRIYFHLGDEFDFEAERAK